MEKKRMHAIIDAFAFACFVFITATGLLMHYILPPGSGRFMELWGMDRHQWGQIHFWISVAFLVVLALHVVLHWRWIISMVKGRPAEGSTYRIALSLLALAALLVLAASPFFASVEQTGSSPRQQNNADYTQENTADSSENESLTSEVGKELSKPIHAKEKMKEQPSYDESIKGSMTLLELTEATGLPYQDVLKEVRIPVDIPQDEKLGRLTKQYGLTMDSIRNAVERLK
jgi:hypothetical protein